MAILPETPRWLVNQERDQEALLVLSFIYSSCCEKQIADSYHILRERHLAEHVPHPVEKLFAPINRRPVLLALALQLFQQATGNSALVYYSSLVIHRMGFRARDALLFNALAALPQLLVLVIVVFSLDRIGRRPALFFSELGIVASLILMGIAMTVVDLKRQFWLLLAGIVLHRVFFAAGMGPVPSVLVAEILPYSVRSQGLALALTVNWLANFLVTASFPLLLDHVEPAWVYGGFASASLLGVGFIAVGISETKGMALDPPSNPVADLEASQSPPVSIRTPEPKLLFR